MQRKKMDTALRDRKMQLYEFKDKMLVRYVHGIQFEIQWWIKEAVQVMLPVEQITIGLFDY